MPFQLARTSYFDGPKSPARRRAGRASGSKGSRKARAMSRVQTAGIIGGTAYALGLVEGKYGMYVFSKDYPWLSADLVGAVAIHVASFYGALPASIDKVAVDAANGAFAYWAGFLGTQHGGGSVKSGNPAAIKGENYREMAQGGRQALTPEQIWEGQQVRR